MPIVKGTKEDLIKRGAEITAEIKVLTEELKGIKEKLKSMHLDKKGIYTTKSGAILEVTTKDNYGDPDPKLVRQELKNIRKGKEFWNVVKINITALRKILDDTVINKCRKKLPDIVAMSFKK